MSGILLLAESAASDDREEAERTARETIESAEKRASEAVAEAQDERRRPQIEVERLETVQAEFEASYRAFLLAGLELIDSKGRATPAHDRSGRQGEEAAA